MKLATFIPPGSLDPRSGEIRGDEAVAFDDGTSVVDRLASGDRSPAGGDAFPLAECELLAPVPRPRAIFGIGLNYAAHAAEQGKDLPKVPIVFMKLPSSVVPGSGPVVCPAAGQAPRLRGRARTRHGRGATRSPATPWPTTSRAATCRAASRSGRGPRAPTPSAPSARGSPPRTRSPTPRRCALRAWVNGELRQDSSTSDLVFGPRALVDFIAEAITLEPGDLILTGTPSGVGMSMDPPRFLQSGDVVRMEIEGLGSIEHPIA